MTRAPSQAGKGLDRALNRVMVPLHQEGFVAWLDSPVAGWQALITTTGAKSGQPRPVPAPTIPTATAGCGARGSSWA